MSRAFVSEDTLTGDVLDRPISPHPNYVTAVGLVQIERALQSARERYGAAQIARDRSELAKSASDLRYWNARRDTARILTPDPNRDCAQFGSRVTIARDGREQTFHIVGEDEAEPSKGTISYVSPLARALIGKEAGDTARLGDSQIEILAISSD
jgi:transcription elongation GreA/GreB family factor